MTWGTRKFHYPKLDNKDFVILPQKLINDPFVPDFRLKPSPYATKPVFHQKNCRDKELARKKAKHNEIKRLEEHLSSKYEQEMSTQALNLDQNSTLQDILKQHDKIINKQFEDTITPFFFEEDLNFPVIQQGSTSNPLASQYIPNNTEEFIPKKKFEEPSPTEKYPPKCLLRKKDFQAKLTSASEQEYQKVIHDLQASLEEIYDEKQTRDMFDMQTLLGSPLDHSDSYHSRLHYENFASPRLTVRLERMMGETFKPEATLYYPKPPSLKRFTFDHQKTKTLGTNPHYPYGAWYMPPDKWAEIRNEKITEEKKKHDDLKSNEKDGEMIRKIKGLITTYGQGIMNEEGNHKEGTSFFPSAEPLTRPGSGSSTSSSKSSHGLGRQKEVTFPHRLPTNLQLKNTKKSTYANSIATSARTTARSSLSTTRTLASTPVSIVIDESPSNLGSRYGSGRIDNESRSLSNLLLMTKGLKASLHKLAAEKNHTRSPLSRGISSTHN